jgi:hypothetical protein
MKKIAIALALLCFTPSLALAEDCEQIQSKDGSFTRWMCPMPDADAPAKCSVVKDKEGENKLLCDREIWQAVPEKRVAPVNCGWRRGKFVCW